MGSSRLPDWSDEKSLPYIRALIKEVHRWAPIASLGIPHATTKTDVYEGVTIPEGTIIFPNLTALSRDPEHYETPDEFFPDRFLDDDLDASASASHPDHRKRDHFHYGFGRRLCQGIVVAEASLFIVVSRTLWGFDIKPLQGDRPLDMKDKISKLCFPPLFFISFIFSPAFCILPPRPLSSPSPHYFIFILTLILRGLKNRYAESSTDLKIFCTGGLVTKPQPFRVNITPRGQDYAATIRRCMTEEKGSDIADFDNVLLATSD